MVRKRTLARCPLVGNEGKPVEQSSNRLPVLAAEIMNAHAEARRAAEMSVGHAIRAGNALIEAKAVIKHGEWLPWLRDNCQMSERTARVYMRLASHKGELGKNGSVADLTIRQALNDIADASVELPKNLPPDDLDAAWEWAERQTVGPFNVFDLEHYHLMVAKLCRQAGVPALVSFALEVHTAEIPAMRLVGWQDLEDAARALVPFAKGETSDLDIDTPDFNLNDLNWLSNALKICAMRMLGVIINEFEHRWRQSDEQYRADAEQVGAALMAHLDAELAKARAAA
jgi:hypothetical protein